MDEFEERLSECIGALERFIKYKLPSKYDCEDVLQEVCMAASQTYPTLQNKDSFKAWLIGIARHKCSDYYRSHAGIAEIPLEAVPESAFACGRMGLTQEYIVRETMNGLTDKSREVLYLYYFLDMPQAQIAQRLSIPVGTVKSRLYAAKRDFKRSYPCPPKEKGESNMKRMPEYMPQYKITPSEKAPFPVIWEELMGWFLVPRQGEKLVWGMYDMPSLRLAELYEMEVVGRTEVHGIEGVEITAHTRPVQPEGAGENVAARRFVAQLTDTHCRFLAESHMRDGIKRLHTFLDSDSFLQNWGFGEDNCGNETHLAAKGDIVREAGRVTAASKPYVLDIVGRYDVDIAGKSYDTVCVMDIETYNPGVASEQYLDKNGRTILWRRFNRDDWAIERYGQRWSEKLPDNERLSINGETYVHWYDCITDYIL